MRPPRRMLPSWSRCASICAPCWGGAKRPAPTYNDLLIKLTAQALLQHPLLNATWQGETLHLWDAVHMGLAVDTAEGLAVPVVRDADSRSTGQIAATTRDLIARAQGRQLQLHEMQGATFTLTNLGMYGIDAFTPIINLPQCAILGVGRNRPSRRLWMTRSSRGSW